MALIVVGGFYIERCVQPLWDAVYGSGGRAAAAVATLVPGTVLLTYVPEELAGDADALAATAGFELRAHPAISCVSFDYLHPLATPRIAPSPGCIPTNSPIRVDGDLVLRFGMLEGDAVVRADVAVYDPQSAFGAKRFTENGSSARRLAIVLNQGEAVSMTGMRDPQSTAAWLMREEGAEVVVLKMGSHGARVATRTDARTIPAYKSERVWKIGSGDVFSAAFTAFWGALRLDPFTAADLASKATAMYCGNRMLPVLDREDLLQAQLEPVTGGGGKIYLAGPFFDIGQRWLVEEAREILADLGANVFSPVHEVGPGPGEMVARLDLQGLEGSDAVFAIMNGLDTGTAFEVGYAVKKGIPVVALAQNIRDEDLKMLVGTGCKVVDDFATGVYQAIWTLPPR